MRLFLYYALHSFKNQLKKLFKTWILVFILVCALLGGLIGLGASKLSELSDSQETAQTETEGQATEPGEAEAAPEPPGFLETQGISKEDMVELIAGLVILIIFCIEALSADKNGSKLFLPADVNLLFSAPMRPQSVLMFRLMTQLGTALAASIYLLFQIPNLVLNLGLGIWAALAVILGWCFTIIVGKLLQLLLYLICSNHPGAKPWVQRAVYAVLALLALGVLLTWKRGGLHPLTAAVRFFNAPGSRWIPFWGWLKGFVMFAVEGRAGLSLLSLAAVLLGAAALILVIRGTKADFYEDAMAKSEELAALMERQRAERSTGLVAGGKRKKDRSERLRRDGLRHGRGANVFFFKTLYNRARFAHFGIFNKTTETYLVAGLGVAAIARFGFGARGFFPVAAVMTAVAFFRALGNPLEQDTKSDYFLLIPENTWAKLFWSLLGGTVNCLLDLLPGFVLAAILLGAPPAEVLGWIPFILAMDFYATSVGAFISLSVPVSAGKNIKQFAQILFIYFGLLPTAAILAIGAVTDRLGVSALIAALLCFFLGLLFFGLTPLFLDPKNRAVRQDAPEAEVDCAAARKRFSRMGFAALAVFLVASALQMFLIGILSLSRPALLERDLVIYLLTFAPQYLIAFPIGFLLLRKVPKAERLPGETMGPGRFLALIPICLFLSYAGNFLGIGVNALLGRLVQTEAVNPIETLAMAGSFPARLLFLAILPPVFEELFFRRALIDRMRPYGEKLAVVTSALMFALFHGNLSQFFYAFALGLVFGYIYLRTGKLRWSVALHMLINFIGSVLAPALVENAGLDALEELDLAALGENAEALAGLAGPGLIAFGAYALALVLLSVAGLVLLIIRARSVHFGRAAQELPRAGRFRTVWLNAGMLVLLAACLCLFVLMLTLA